MPNFDNDILIKNIKFQMEKAHETQKQVAEAIGMSQPNFNKAINGVDGKLFTLEQLYNISQHFNIGIDRLMSNDTSWSLGTMDICKFLVKLIESGDAIFTDCELPENVYTPDPIFPEQISSCFKANKYKALVFNIFRGEPDGHGAGIVDSTLNASLKQFTVNEFIKNYLEVFKLYSQGILSKEIYEITVEGLLQKTDIDYLL